MATETPGETEFTRTMDPAGSAYLDWAPPGAAISIHMHLGVVEAIAGDVIEGFGTLPRRGLEVGGLLLGRVILGPRPTAWIERYQRISCQHRFGPQFILDSHDTSVLEDAAAKILAGGELAVVGFYRSHTRPGFQLEASDFELIRRYFSDPSDLILLVKPQNLNNIAAQFYAWDAASGAQPVGDRFPFPVNSEARTAIPDTSPTAPTIDREAVAGKEAATEPSAAEPTEAPAVQPERPRRLVPDFPRSPVEPSPLLHGLGGRSAPDRLAWPEMTQERGVGDMLKKWLPLVAAMLLVGGILWFLLAPSRQGTSATTPAQTAETARPLGLYVDPLGKIWHVMWNPNATALRDARSVQLFVREGDDQNRIDLPARDLVSGSYEYTPAGNDVTFRLEVMNRSGQMSAESFRLIRQPNPDAVESLSTPSSPARPPGAAPNAAPPPAGGAKRITPPKAIYRAPPVVAAGIRPRINGKIPVDIRVNIDTRGHVLTATPVVKPHSGLEEYLATRAVQAARLWRFDPARENGKAVQGTQTIHFVFEK